MASSEVIRFDSEYMRSRAKVVTQAGEYLDDAIECLRQANRHDGWQCSERAEINKKLDEIKKRLAKIKDNAVTPVAAALSSGAEQFAELETRSAAQEQQIAGQMREDWGYKPTPWQQIAGAFSNWWSRMTGGGDAQGKLSVTPIPLSWASGTAVLGASTVQTFSLSGETQDATFWDKLGSWIRETFPPKAKPAEPVFVSVEKEPSFLDRTGRAISDLWSNLTGGDDGMPDYEIPDLSTISPSSSVAKPSSPASDGAAFDLGKINSVLPDAPPWLQTWVGENLGLNKKRD